MKRFKRVYVEITNICNLSCTFCPETKRKAQTMTSIEFSHILHQIGPYTDYIYLHVKGEPLLHPELKEILDLCYERNKKVIITSNGTLLDHAWNTIITSPAIRQINISIHSIGANEKINHIDYMETILDKAKYLSKNTSIITSLRLWNLQEGQDSIVDNNLNFQIFKYLESAFQTDTPVSIGELKKRGIKLGNRIYLNGATEFEWPSLNSPYYEPVGYCYGLNTQIGILVDGTVIPCCLDGEGIVNLGNIKKETFSQIINSPRVVDILEAFKNRQAKEELCKHCGYKSRF